MGRHKAPCNSDLPVGVRHIGGRYYLRPPEKLAQDLGRTSIPLGIDREIAIKRAVEIIEYKGGVSAKKWVRRSVPIDVLKSMMYRCRHNGKRRRVESTMTLADLKILSRRLRGRCELTGIPFDFSKGPAWMRPWAASIDRIDPKRGYHLDNCRLVCFVLNTAMNQWGIDPVIRLAKALLDPRRSRRKTLPIALEFGNFCRCQQKFGASSQDATS